MLRRVKTRYVLAANLSIKPGEGTIEKIESDDSKFRYDSRLTKLFLASCTHNEFQFSIFQVFNELDLADVKCTKLDCHPDTRSRIKLDSFILF